MLDEAAVEENANTARTENKSEQEGERERKKEKAEGGRETRGRRTMLETNSPSVFFSHRVRESGFFSENNVQRRHANEIEKLSTL